MPAQTGSLTAKRSGDDAAEVLVRDRRRFLAFLTARLGDDDLAEEVLQAAYLKSLQKGGEIRDGENAAAWFFRVLRNAIVDHHRSRQRKRGLVDRYAKEQRAAVDPDELREAACQCVAALVPELRPDYADALRRIDLEDASVSQLAAELGISPSNAGVRLHRARRALRKRVQEVCGSCATHGCRDCGCRRPKA